MPSLKSDPANKGDDDELPPLVDSGSDAEDNDEDMPSLIDSGDCDKYKGAHMSEQDVRSRMYKLR